MNKTNLNLLVLVGACLCAGCATTPGPSVTHLYDGPPRPLDQVAILDSNGGKGVSTISTVDGKAAESRTIAVLPGSHEVRAWGGFPLATVARTGISTTPEMRASSGQTMFLSVTAPGAQPVRIALDDKRIAQATEELKRNNMRTISFDAKANRRYVLHCELTKEDRLTERGIWIEEAGSSTSK